MQGSIQTSSSVELDIAFKIQYFNSITLNLSGKTLIYTYR